MNPLTWPATWQLLVAAAINLVTVFSINKLTIHSSDVARQIGWAVLVAVTIVPVQFLIWGAKQQMHGNLSVAIAVVISIVTIFATAISWSGTEHAHPQRKLLGLAIALVGITIASWASMDDKSREPQGDESLASADRG